MAVLVQVITTVRSAKRKRSDIIMHYDDMQQNSLLTFRSQPEKRYFIFARPFSVLTELCQELWNNTITYRTGRSHMIHLAKPRDMERAYEIIRE